MQAGSLFVDLALRAECSDNRFDLQLKTAPTIAHIYSRKHALAVIIVRHPCNFTADVACITAVYRSGVVERLSLT